MDCHFVIISSNSTIKKIDDFLNKTNTADSEILNVFQADEGATSIDSVIESLLKLDAHTRDKVLQALSIYCDEVPSSKISLIADKDYQVSIVSNTTPDEFRNELSAKSYEQWPVDYAGRYLEAPAIYCGKIQIGGKQITKVFKGVNGQKFYVLNPNDKIARRDFYNYIKLTNAYKNLSIETLKKWGFDEKLLKNVFGKEQKIAEILTTYLDGGKPKNSKYNSQELAKIFDIINAHLLSYTQPYYNNVAEAMFDQLVRVSQSVSLFDILKPFQDFGVLDQYISDSGVDINEVNLLEYIDKLSEDDATTLINKILKSPYLNLKLDKIKKITKSKPKEKSKEETKKEDQKEGEESKEETPKKKEAYVQKSTIQLIFSKPYEAILGKLSQAQEATADLSQLVSHLETYKDFNIYKYHDEAKGKDIYFYSSIVATDNTYSSLFLSEQDVKNAIDNKIKGKQIIDLVWPTIAACKAICNGSNTVYDTRLKAHDIIPIRANLGNIKKELSPMYERALKMSLFEFNRQFQVNLESPHEAVIFLFYKMTLGNKSNADIAESIRSEDTTAYYYVGKEAETSGKRSHTLYTVQPEKLISLEDILIDSSMSMAAMQKFTDIMKDTFGIVTKFQTQDDFDTQIKAIKESDLKKEEKDKKIEQLNQLKQAHAYITSEDGKSVIYVNAWRCSSSNLMHEYSHYILEIVRSINPEVYYQIITNFDTLSRDESIEKNKEKAENYRDAINKLKQLDVYKNCSYNQLVEEILADQLGDRLLLRLDNRTDQQEQYLWNVINQVINKENNRVLSRVASAKTTGGILDALLQVSLIDTKAKEQVSKFLENDLSKLDEISKLRRVDNYISSEIANKRIEEDCSK